MLVRLGQNVQAILGASIINVNLNLPTVLVATYQVVATYYSDLFLARSLLLGKDWDLELMDELDLVSPNHLSLEDEAVE